MVHTIMATMPAVNLTECGQCSGVEAEFTTLQLIVTACGAYCAGIVTVLLVVLILKLKKEKKMCFREAEEPFRGKWEGASQKATIQVLKKHTLEKSLSYDKNKPMETSVEANDVLKESANQGLRSVEEEGIVKTTDERDFIPDVSISVENEGNILNTTKSTTNSAEQPFNKTTVLDNDSKLGVEPDINTNGAMDEHNTSSENETPNEDSIKDGAMTKEYDNKTANDESSLDKSDKVSNKESKETNIDPRVTVVDTDNPFEIQPNNVRSEASEELDARQKESEDGTKHITDKDDLEIVRDSSGAELYEKGRDSVVFDPDELMVQNDNFRISQLSYN